MSAILCEIAARRQLVMEARERLLNAELVSAELADARMTQTHLIGVLDDGGEIATPLAWYPRLRDATMEQRARFELSPFGIHWPELDEDLSVEGMLAGERAQIG